MDLKEGEAFKTFTTSFKMKEATDEGTVLSIAMGGESVTTQHTIFLDNITLEEIDESELPDDGPIEQEKNVNLLKNPEFAEEGKDWDSGFDTATGGVGTVAFAENKVTFNITNVGTKDYSANLKQTGVSLKKGETYEVKFKIKSYEH